MKHLKAYAVVLVALSFIVVGCAQRAATPEEAIQQAQSKPSVDAQVNYLVGQANAFISSEKFEDAIKIAKHILSNLDANSQEAKSLIERAQEEITKMAQQKIEEAKGDVKNALGNLGQ